MEQNLFLLFMFRVLTQQELLLEVEGGDANTLVNELKPHFIATVNGCPYSYDHGIFNYIYVRPESCDTLIPKGQFGFEMVDPIAPFKITFEVPWDTNKNYYRVTLEVVDEEFDKNITGVFLKAERLKSNLRPGNAPAGHFEGTNPPWELGMCCTKSKFMNLANFYDPEGEGYRKVEIRWYQMNFGRGDLVMRAHVFTSIWEYWKVDTGILQIPPPGQDYGLWVD